MQVGTTCERLAADFQQAEVQLASDLQATGQHDKFTTTVETATMEESNPSYSRRNEPTTAPTLAPSELLASHSVARSS